jgi:hypothetical protein
MSDLRKRMVESSRGLKSRDMSIKPPGGSFSTYYTLPEGLETWIPKHSIKGTVYYFDIVPFPFGPNFPNEPWRTPWKATDYPYTLIVDFHKNIGAENAWIVCPKGCYAEPCPICEDLKVLQKDVADKDARIAIWKPLRIWRRQFYYVIVRGRMEDGKYREEDPDLKFWEIPTAFMGDPLEAIKYQGRSGEVIEYYDVDDGKTIKFMYKTQGEYGDMSGHAFEDRIDPVTKKKYVIEDEFIEQAASFPLDRALKRLTYDEIAKIYHSGVEKKEDEEPTVSRRTRPASVEEPQDEPEEEAPPPTRRRRTAAAEPEKPKEGECPENLKWGVDCLKKEECDSCETEYYNSCQDEQDRLKALEPPARRRRR